MGFLEFVGSEKCTYIVIEFCDMAFIHIYGGYTAWHLSI